MKKILLIEDNSDMRENTAELLELASYQVITAENGKTGMELAKKEKPDLIICDIMMPVLDGYGVLYMLEKDPATAIIPFIFLTAKADKSDLRKGMNMGADDYLTKPFEEIELLNSVESRLKKSEILKRDYQNNIEDLSRFLSDAQKIIASGEISESLKARTYKKKEIIYYEGDYPSGIYFINKGKIKVFKNNDEGKELITGLYTKGEFIGFMSLLSGENYTDSASALEDTEMYKISRDDFLALIYNNKEVATRFIKLISKSLVEKEEQMIKLAYNSVRKRVAEALISLQNKYHNKSDELFSMPVSRDDLASMVGTAPETVIRTLSELKEDRLIDIKGSQITILKPDDIEKMRY